MQYISLNPTWLKSSLVYYFHYCCDGPRAEIASHIKDNGAVSCGLDRSLMQPSQKEIKRTQREELDSIFGNRQVPKVILVGRKLLPHARSRQQHWLPKSIGARENPIKIKWQNAGAAGYHLGNLRQGQEGLSHQKNCDLPKSTHTLRKLLAQKLLAVPGASFNLPKSGRR